MNDKAEITLRKVFDRDFLKTIKRVFGGKPKITASEGVAAPHDRITIQFEQVDSGNEWMTYGDVAAHLNVDVSTVHYWNRARTRAAARFPFPKTSNHAGPRIRRTELLAWIKAQEDAREPVGKE